MVMTAGGLIGSDGDLPYPQQLKAAEAALRRGTLSMDRVNDAVGRIIRVKLAMGLLPASLTSATTATGEATGEALAWLDSHSIRFPLDLIRFDSTRRDATRRDATRRDST